MSTKKLEINYIREFQLFDRDHFQILKGISIVAAIVAYICSTFWGIHYLTPVQGIAGAVFLFCSGYGVSESYERKGGLVHFWENKVMKVWLPSLVVMVAMSLIIQRNFVIWIAESPLGLKGSILYLFFGAYAVFWALFSFVEGKAARCVGLFAAAGIAFCFVSNTTLASVLLCFPTGVLFSQYGLKYKLRAMKAGRLLICLACLALTAAGWALGVMTQIAYVETLIWSVTYLAGALFLAIGVYAAKKLPIFGIFVPFGYMSYGLYLFYDYILVLLRGAGNLQTYALIIGLLLVVAGVYSWLREMLVILNKNIRRRKSTRLKGSMW